jgi:predicted acetyltransferase
MDRAEQQGTPGGATLVLRALTLQDEAVARTAQAELALDGFSFLLHVSEGQDWAQYVERLDQVSRGAGLGPGQVPATFLVAEVHGKIVGRTSIRHELNEYLATVGGHIGFGVRPQFRRRGYATEILRQSLRLSNRLRIDPALVTCDDDNRGSAAVIEACGGILDVVVRDPDGGAPRRRYWVDTAAPR